MPTLWKRCHSIKPETLSLKAVINKLNFSKKTVISNETFEKKDLLLLTTKLTVKLPDPRNAKEHYQSFIRKKNTKSVKQSKIITQHPKTFENPNIVDIKSVIIAHAKTLHKLPKTIRQKKVSLVGSNSPLYSDTKKLKFFWPKKRRNNKTRICF